MKNYSILFPEDYDELAAFEHSKKGYLRDVVVRLESAGDYILYFIDPVRLQQDLESEVESGRSYLSEPNMIVIPEVTREAIETTVASLVEEGFFERLGPRTGL